MKNPFLVGETVYLRPFDLEDAPRATEWMSDREVTATFTAYERAGFNREEVRREARLRGGGRVDSIIMAILRSEWRVGGDG
jgi:RimJ/RimL family protein N-acetyltransferase